MFVGDARFPSWWPDTLHSTPLDNLPGGGDIENGLTAGYGLQWR